MSDEKSTQSNQGQNSYPKQIQMGNVGNSAQPSAIRIIIWLIVNFLSSILIIFQNKYIFSYLGFPNISLTCIHFIVTYLMLELCYIYGMFEKKGIPFNHLLLLSLSFCGFVALTNLSLQFNTVGTSQIIKVLTMPSVALLEFLYYTKILSTRVYATFVSPFNSNS